MTVLTENIHAGSHRRHHRIFLLLLCTSLLLLSAAFFPERAYAGRSRKWVEYRRDFSSAGQQAAARPCSSSSAFYGRQLTGDARKIYSAMVKTWVEKNGSADDYAVIQLDGNYSYRPQVKKSRADGLYRWVGKRRDRGYRLRIHRLYNALDKAIAAFDCDYPEVFWAYGYLFYTVLPTVNARSPHQKLSDISRIEQLYLTEKVRGLSSASARRRFRSAVSAGVSWVYARGGSGASDSTKARLAHDYIAKKARYKEGPYCRSAYGVFGGDGALVCEGYAKAYKVLCDRLGIPCIIASGTANQAWHMWNYVKIGGKWYLTDVTWDDIRSCHEYFLVGCDTSVSGITVKKNRTFSRSLSWKIRGGSCAFSLPPLSSGKYRETTRKTGVKKQKVHIYISAKGLKKNGNLTVKKKSRTKLKIRTSSPGKIFLSSSNRNVATVTSGGIIRAKKKGKTKITVRSGGRKKVITVRVR